MRDEDLYAELQLRYSSLAVLIVEGPQDATLMERALDDQSCEIIHAGGSTAVRSVRKKVQASKSSGSWWHNYPIVFLLDADFANLAVESEKNSDGSGTVVTEYNDLDAEIFFHFEAVDEYVERAVKRSDAQRMHLESGGRSVMSITVDLYVNLLHELEELESGRFVPLGNGKSTFEWIDHSSLIIKDLSLRQARPSHSIDILDYGSAQLPPIYRMNGHHLFTLANRVMQVWLPTKGVKDLTSRARELFSGREISNLPSVRRVVQEFHKQGVWVARHGDKVA
ncbi:hypothetical protein [Kocuria rosea]|uniref:hypothetical protein n=1 Tax=Kocuria rosea TaxID=1275 RepID=UPI000F8168DF|nr:hypothetical protein [Kocuria rosea]